MAPTIPSTPSGSRTRLPPLVPMSVSGPRVTRLRAAKDTAASGSGSGSGSGTGTGTPVITPLMPTVVKTNSSFLSRGKEGFRKVSEKIKEKEKEKEAIKARPPTVDSSSYSETLKAYLRIRPSPPDEADQAGYTRPYLEPQGDKDVIMRAPIDPSRPHVPKPPHIYSFDHVFPPATSQLSFFAETTLPLVDKLLKGENGLLFAYGVSNSGKTYSISGANTASQEDRGVLPRAIDVVYNSIAGLESKVNLRCTALADVELTGVKDPKVLDGVFPDLEGASAETCGVDRNYSYAVFVSYAEVYNERIFDLLDNILPITPSGRSRPSALPRQSSHLAMPGGYVSAMSLAAIANGGAGVIKRKALSLKNDPEGNGKYIAGLNEIRVRTRQEALAVFHSGQRARQVFGTLANRESSRSHGIFTIKVVRIHNGAPEDPDSAQVSRLAIVDLAGSERMRNTGTSGDRLKEAGNINKSLMVLGQCLEVLRSNQQSMAAPSLPGRKRKLAVVPFRHSKLTEVFQNFFVGDGRAVMIVHVNPYDTGFDENSHVMRFSAIARDIQTTASNKVGFPHLKRQISTQFSALRQAVSGPMKVKVTVPVLAKPEHSSQLQGRTVLDPNTNARSQVMAPPPRERESDGYVLIEEELEVVEEDDSASEGEDEPDWMVEHLFEQLREARLKLYESEMRNATIEAEIREEAAQEMQDALQKMHADFSQLLSDQVAASELKADRKLDILSRTIPTPLPQRTRAFAPGSGITEEEVGDESFQSAMDDSMSSENSKVHASRISDPFLTRPQKGAEVAADEIEEFEATDTEDESADEAEVMRALQPHSRQTSDETTVASARVKRIKRTETEEIEDPLSKSVEIGEVSMVASELRSVGAVGNSDESEEEAVGSDTQTEESAGERAEDASTSGAETESEDEEEDILGLDEPDHAIEQDGTYGEEEEEEADDENTGASELDSSFAISTDLEAESGSGDDDEDDDDRYGSSVDSPVRRISMKRRTTGSPVKPSGSARRERGPRKPSPVKKTTISTSTSPKKRSSPVKANGAGITRKTKVILSDSDSPMSGSEIESGSMKSPMPMPMSTTVSNSKTKANVKTNANSTSSTNTRTRPLRDSLVQPKEVAPVNDEDDETPAEEEEEDEEEEVVIKPGKAHGKKKRILGKKVITEDELVLGEKKVLGGAEPRRMMVRGGGK